MTVCECVVRYSQTIAILIFVSLWTEKTIKSTDNHKDSTRARDGGRASNNNEKKKRINEKKWPFIIRAGETANKIKWNEIKSRPIGDDDVTIMLQTTDDHKIGGRTFGRKIKLIFAWWLKYRIIVQIGVESISCWILYQHKSICRVWIVFDLVSLKL